MSAQEGFLGLVHPGREVRRAPLVGMKFLHQRPVGAPDGLGVRPRLKAQDLVSLLFRHRARLRLAARPRVLVSLSVFTPEGKPAVEIRFEKPHALRV